MPDSEEIAHLHALLQAHCRTLRLLQEQIALSGRVNAPPHLLNGIEDTRMQIQQITATLRAFGADVADCPDSDPKRDPAKLFSAATQAHLTGDLWEAKRLYEQVLVLDPFYPRAAERLEELKRLLPRPVIERSGAYSGCEIAVIILVIILVILLVTLPIVQYTLPLF